MTGRGGLGGSGRAWAGVTTGSRTSVMTGALVVVRGVMRNRPRRFLAAGAGIGGVRLTGAGGAPPAGARPPVFCAARSGRIGSLPMTRCSRGSPNSPPVVVGLLGGGGGDQVLAFLASGTPRGGLKPGGSQVDFSAAGGATAAGRGAAAGGLTPGRAGGRGALRLGAGFRAPPAFFAARSGRIGILPTRPRSFLPPNSPEVVDFGRGGGFGGV